MEVLLEYGIVNAVNLDGGGSATYTVNGTLVNYPSDTWSVFIQNTLDLISVFAKFLNSYLNICIFCMKWSTDVSEVVLFWPSDRPSWSLGYLVLHYAFTCSDTRNGCFLRSCDFYYLPLAESSDQNSVYVCRWPKLKNFHIFIFLQKCLSITVKSGSIKVSMDKKSSKLFIWRAPPFLQREFLMNNNNTLNSLDY